jgi:hypothetical protein
MKAMKKIVAGTGILIAALAARGLIPELRRYVRIRRM